MDEKAFINQQDQILFSRQLDELGIDIDVLHLEMHSFITNFVQEVIFDWKEATTGAPLISLYQKNGSDLSLNLIYELLNLTRDLTFTQTLTKSVFYINSDEFYEVPPPCYIYITKYEVDDEKYGRHDLFIHMHWDFKLGVPYLIRFIDSPYKNQIKYYGFDHTFYFSQEHGLEFMHFLAPNVTSVKFRDRENFVELVEIRDIGRNDSEKLIEISTLWFRLNTLHIKHSDRELTVWYNNSLYQKDKPVL